MAITEIEEAPAAAYARNIKDALAAALVGVGKLDPAVLEIPGMSGRRYRYLINHLIGALPNPAYLEVGSWAGSTLCSAINGNKVRATAIDNWSEFGGPRDQFLQNLQRFSTPAADMRLIESDFREVDYYSIGRFNVYLFDGPHTMRDHYDGLAVALPALEKQFIFIVDDWNWEPVRLGTFTAIHSLGLSFQYSLEIRTSLDGSEPNIKGSASDWHNGYMIAVLEQPTRQAPQGWRG
jgi:hypothetical protein